MADLKTETQWEETSGFSSSNIDSFGFDRNTDTLRVDFSDGSQYELYNVPPPVHRQFQSALSKGEFYARHLKGRYSYARV